jgi:ATP-binding cassette subfamily B protein
LRHSRPPILAKSATPKISGADLKDLLLPAFKRYRLRLALGFTALVIVDFLQLTIPRIIKHAVDSLAGLTVTTGELAWYGVIIIAIAAIVVLLRFCWRYMIIGFSRLLETGIRNRIFDHILKMDAPFFERYTTGDLMAHSSNDLSAVQMACGMGMVAAADALVMSVAAICFMLIIDPTLTLLALLPMPFLAVATRILSGRLHNRFSTVQEQFSELTEFSRSTLISFGLIKAYTMEDFQTSRFDGLGRQYVQSNLKVARIQGLISPLATLVGSIGMLMVLYFGGRLVIESAITLGDFVAFITYLYMLIWPMMAIGWVANLVQRGLTSLGRINTLVKSTPILPDPATAPSERRISPGFAIHGLSWRYSSAKDHVLRDVSLDFGPGIHGITGRTGSGKTTLCRVLSRQLPVEDGVLYFAGMDVNSLPLEYVRSHIAYVSQEPVLFSDSIAQNIALARPAASPEEISRAARDAAVHEDIEALPEGYNTMIGERGVKLSGGQRQRIALARALLSDRPVLVIDDGLSAVDVATEHEVFQGLQQRFSGKTVIIVSNRVKLLSMTDEITILARGSIECQGTHAQLLSISQLYQSMYEKQAKDEESDEDLRG